MKLIFIYFILILSNCLAGFISIENHPTPSLPHWSGMYLAPNELNIQAMEAVLKNAPEGVYLTVGTERAFMGVSLADNADHLLVVDMDPKVIEYNMTIQALLVAARSPEEFFKLKFMDNYFKWEDAKQNLLSRDYNDLALFLSKKSYDNFRKIILQNRGVQINIKYEELFVSDKNKNAKFNYHKNGFSFLKLKSMAEEDRMQFILGDLKDIHFTLKILALLQSIKLKISVFDISNLNDLYIPRVVLAETLMWVQRISRSDTLLVGTFHFPFNSYFYSSNWSDNIETQPDAYKLLAYIDLMGMAHAEAQLIGNAAEIGVEKRVKMSKVEESLDIREILFSNEELNHIFFKPSCKRYFRF